MDVREKKVALHVETCRLEHVFVGEIDGRRPNSPVSGFHNWVRYYLEERSGRLEYQRWKGQIDVGKI